MTAKQQRERRERLHWLLFGTPQTLREHLAHWLAWRCMAAHNFVLWCVRVNPKTRHGSRDIAAAPTHWYIERFVQGWRLGALYITRVQRDMRRLFKSVT